MKILQFFLALIITTGGTCFASQGQENLAADTECLENLNSWLAHHNLNPGELDLVKVEESLPTFGQVAKSCEGKNNKPAKIIARAHERLYSSFLISRDTRILPRKREAARKEAILAYCELDVWVNSACEGKFNSKILDSWRTLCADLRMGKNDGCTELELDSKRRSKSK